MSESNGDQHTSEWAGNQRIQTQANPTQPNPTQPNPRQARAAPTRTRAGEGSGRHRHAARRGWEGGLFPAARSMGGNQPPPLEDLAKPQCTWCARSEERRESTTRTSTPGQRHEDGSRTWVWVEMESSAPGAALQGTALLQDDASTTVGTTLRARAFREQQGDAGGPPVGWRTTLPGHKQVQWVFPTPRRVVSSAAPAATHKQTRQLERHSAQSGGSP